MPPIDDDRIDRVLRALSDRTRRGILNRLSRGPASVSDLADPFDISLPAVSRHVKVLERAGLVAREIKGRTHVCVIRPESVREVEDWLRHYRTYWNETLDSLTRYAEDAEKK